MYQPVPNTRKEDQKTYVLSLALFICSMNLTPTSLVLSGVSLTSPNDPFVLGVTAAAAFCFEVLSFRLEEEEDGGGSYIVHKRPC